MILTVKDLIQLLKECNPEDSVYLAADWANEEFVGVTDVITNQLFNPTAGDFETKMHNADGVADDNEEIEDWEEIEAHGIKCIVIT